jgi:hypothetical protein
VQHLQFPGCVRPCVRSVGKQQCGERLDPVSVPLTQCVGPCRVHLQAINGTRLLPWNLPELPQLSVRSNPSSSHCKCPLSCGTISPSLKMDTLLVDSVAPNTQWGHTVHMRYSRCPLKMQAVRFTFRTLVTVPICPLQVYLLILSVTTLSLLLAPVLWKAAITKCVPRPERRSSL